MLARRFGTLGLVMAALAAVCVAALPASAVPQQGKLSGVVVDPAGIPQMGATVWVIGENSRGTATLQLLTSEKGVFTADRLLPGLYSVRVTLAGFLPALERHVRIEANLSTLLKIELDSLFTSMDRLRRRPRQAPQDDEWTWVLRGSASTRPVLRYGEEEVTAVEEATRAVMARASTGPRGYLEIATGSRRPGSAGNLADSPSSAFAFEQVLGPTSRLLLAGQASYEDSGTAGISATWLPAGENGPRSTVVLRQVNLSHESRLRTMRLDHEGGMTLGDRVELRYGVEYVMVGLDRTSAALLPRGELRYLISPSWRTTLSLTPNSGRGSAQPSALQSALETLDTFPAITMRNSRPVLDTGRHEELAMEHLMGPNARLVAAVFHDRSAHTAMFGRGPVENAEFFHDAFFDGFAYDGGQSSSWGARLAFQRKLGGESEFTVVYSFAGALAADEVPEGAESLRDFLTTRQRHSLGARVSTRVPRLGTRMAASYKWLSGPVVSRHDPIGETAFQLDPYLNLQVRQPLPGQLFSGRIEAVADFRNLLAQGYVPVSLRDGSIILMPTFRSFRGGLSFQF